MPFNGSGSFSPYTPGNPVITGTVISSTAFNATMTDIAAGLTNAITRDGQSPPSANLPMASNKLTGLGAGTVSGDSLRFQQLFSQGAPASLPSAATVDIGGQNSVAVEISGTTGITSFGTNYNGPRYIRFAGALLLTHNATTLNLPGAANITTVAGDTCVAYPNLAGNGWNIIQYTSINGLWPVGSVIYHAANSAPSGYLKANGAAVSRTTYAALFTAISTTFGVGDGSTTFNVPDLRGEFLRGWDDGRGVDTGRVFGSAQAQDLQPHTHSLNAVISDSGATYNLSGTYSRGSAISGTGSTGTTETRPRNVALLACIKF